MPIPQLKQSQSWRKNKKRYYVGNTKNRVVNLNKKRSSKNFNFFDKSSFANWKKKILVLCAILFLIGVIFVLSVVAWVSKDLPDPNQLIAREIAQSTKIYDRTGEVVLYEIHGEEKRTLISFEEIPDYVKNATVAIEDKNFYEHGGFSLWAIFRTAIKNIITGQRAGGSTLTQQFVKNSILTNEKTYIRKIKELLLAYKVEKKFTKDEILQMYLNEIPYGSNAYGVEAASQKYFGKSVKDDTLAEAAILAALPQAPSRYSPYGSNRDLLIGRQQYILDIMFDQGYITEDEAADAKEQELVFAKPKIDIKAPHFVMYIKEQLSEKYGEKMIEQGGLKITTTLDMYKQKIAEETVTELAEKNEANYQATNAALVSIDPKTGQVLTMVGSKDYFSDDIDGQVNITTSLRQPGSSMKPFVYAAAFLKGYTVNTILYDVVTNFSNNDDEPYEPHNYDSKEHGPVSIRKALAGSLNIPAVKALYLVGVKNFIELAREIGYSTFEDENRFGLSLVLGGGEVKMIEHVNAYSAFAREGLISPITTILKVEDSEGNIIEEFKNKDRKVIDPKVARQINDVLSDNNARAYAFGEQNWLTLGNRPVAAKTGTTNDYKDAWTIGYTPSIVTGVWVGNNDSTPMKRGAAGGVVAAPIWHDYMKAILGDTPVEYFKEAEIPKTGKAMLDGETGLESKIKIDKISGLLATEDTPPEFIEEISFAQPHSILYYVDKNDPLGEVPENPEKDPQYDLWENGVQQWMESEELSSTTPPTEYDDVHTTENIPQIRIVEPTKNQTVLEKMLDIKVNAIANRGVEKVEYYINDILFTVSYESPFTVTKDVSFLPNGFHNLKARACDDAGNCKIDETEFNLILENNNNTSTESLKVSLINPASGLALNNIDFPYNIKLSLNSPSVIASIDLYLVNENDETVLIKNIQPVESSVINTAWDLIPASGTYKIYGEAKTWGGKTITTSESTVIINNTENSEEPVDSEPTEEVVE